MNSNKPQKTGVSTVEIGPAQLGQRLDNFLFKHLQNVPRTRVYRIIRKGEVRVNKKRCKPEYKLEAGDVVRIPPIQLEPVSDGKPQPPASLLKQLEDRTLFQNPHLIIVDKPAGVAVHAGSGVSFGVIDAMRALHPDEDIELVHRLDRDTSGCLVLARHRQALLTLQRLMRDDSLHKQYIAVVRGNWPNHLTSIDLPLRKYHMTNGERRVRVDRAGKWASSRVQLLQGGSRYSIIRVELVTGRTHQIRVHCQSQGHEIAGDDKYGNSEFNRDMRKRGLRRLLLHAASLELPQTDYTPEIVINAPLPDEFESLMTSS